MSTNDPRAKHPDDFYYRRNAKEVEDFNLFLSPADHPMFQKTATGDSMSDLEELKRLQYEN